MHELQSHYRLEAGRYLIELKLNEVRQLFNSFDPAPFVEKDLDDEAAAYLVESVQEFHRGTPLKLVIHLPERELVGDTARWLGEAVHNYFAYRATAAARRLRHTLGDGRTSLFIGIAFLLLCVAARAVVARLGEGAVAWLIGEGLLISGWVAMWRPIQTFLYDWWPISRRRRVYATLAAIEIEVRPLPPPAQPAA